MVSLYRTHPFGDAVTSFRSRKHGLSQAQLALHSDLDITVLSHMCNGRRLEGFHARTRVLQVIKGLYKTGALKSLEEANSLLRAARLADLDASDGEDSALLDLLNRQSTATLLNLAHQPPATPVRLSDRGLVSVMPIEPSPSSADAVEQRTARGNATPVHLCIDTAHPFTVGGPVIHPRSFFGRSRELRRLSGLLSGPQVQNGAVIGSRYMGKTSLLRYLVSITRANRSDLRPGQAVDWLQNPDGYLWVYADLQDMRLATPRLILQYILNKLGMRVPKKCTLDDFARLIREQLKLSAVILLDNLDVALEYSPKLDYEFWTGLSSIAQYDAAGRLGFISSTQQLFATMTQRRIVCSSFFASMATTIELGPLSESEAVEIIEASPIPFSSQDKEWILTHSALAPMPLQLLCRERLHSLEVGDRDDSWQEEALRQISSWAR